MSFPEALQQQEAALLADAERIETRLPGGSFLAWQRWSSGGVPLVLLHGGFGSWNHWFANIAALRDERELWTVDLPGLGNSGDIPRGAGVADFAACLLNGLDELIGDREYQLAGFSFGAMIGALVAADARCSRFVAIGSAGCGDLHHQVPLQPPPPPDTPWSEACRVHRANLESLMFSSGAVIDEMAVYLHASNLARHRFNSRALSRTGAFLEALPSVAGELVCIWGSEDATAGGRQRIDRRRDVIREARPAAGFHVLEGVGHWSMYETPATLNQLLLAAG